MSAFDRPLKAGVIGIGSLGREHARIYASLDRIGSLTLYDREGSRAEEVAAPCGARTSATIEGLLESCDVVSICTPATHHFDAARLAFERGVHVLVEKPLAQSSAEGRTMVEEAVRAGLVLQVGHIERFNGAFQAALPLLTEPMFIESHRLATFTPRGIDVSVVVDLMIHDIDLILTVLKDDAVRELRASGTAVITDSPDIVNARIEFESGCVANITASRISREPLRKIRFFQEHLYVSLDLRQKTIEAFEKTGAGIQDVAIDPMSCIRPVPVTVDRREPLEKEIVSFLDAVGSGRRAAVPGEEGLEALVVAERVLEAIEGVTRR
ncbi:MAG: Gfo/Idh/MocA family oxidoreductase [bacterium]|nr:MAG: Gfo/Idh/MocA family oxidoreductase [bacterium]